MNNARQETIADIVREMRVYAKNSKVNGGEVDVWNWLADYADRIEAAHKREIAAKDDERLTIVANYETIIAAKDAEAAELRERIKVAEDALEKIDNMCDGDMCKFFENTHHCSACRYLDECQTGVAHAAVAAIRGKGVKDGK